MRVAGGYGGPANKSFATIPVAALTTINAPVPSQAVGCSNNQWSQPMKPLIPTAFIAILFAFTGPVAAEPDHHDHHHEAGLGVLELNDGEKWASDEHLRRGMEGIREAFVAIHDRVRDGEATSEDYRSLAEAIDEQVAYMFDSCHLDPEPDAQLHILLANLMQAADTLRGDDNHYPGVHRVHQSLKAYSETFKHPGWKPVSHTD